MQSQKNRDTDKTTKDKEQKQFKSLDGGETDESVKALHDINKALGIPSTSEAPAEMICCCGDAECGIGPFTISRRRR